MLVICLTANVATAQEAREAELVGVWTDTTLVGSWAHNNTFNEVWGVTVDGNEYAIIGSTAGTHIIDLQDANNPTELFRIPGGTNGGEIIHRDYHDWNGYLYAVADEGAESALQIIDISNLPASASVVYESQEFSNRTHNLFIDTTQSMLYLCANRGTEVGYSPLTILDISDPIAPTFVANYGEVPGIGVIGHFHDAFIDDGLAYLNAGNQGFAYVDFNDPQNPEVIGFLNSSDYVQSGYNHSGWPTLDRDYYYMADETHGMDIKVLDMTQLPDIFVVDTIGAQVESQYSIPHNQIVHGDYMYSSYYYDGLQVYDLTNPAKPQLYAYYNTSSIPARNRYEGAWGVFPFFESGLVLVSDMQEGLHILRLPQSVSVQDELETDGIAILPNPNRGSFTVDLGHLATANTKVTLANADGVTFQSTQATTDKRFLTFDLSLPQGVYYLQIKSDTQCITKSVIVQH